MSYGVSPYAGMANVLASLLGNFGEPIAESLGAEPGSNLSKGAGSAISALLGAGLGYGIGGSGDVLAGTASGLAPQLLRYGAEAAGLGQSAGGGGQTTTGKNTGASGGVPGASKASQTNQQTSPDNFTGLGSIMDPTSIQSLTDTLNWQGPSDLTTANASGTPSDGNASVLLQLLKMQNDPRYMALTQGPQLAAAFTGMAQNNAWNSYQNQLAQQRAQAQAQQLAQFNQNAANLYPSRFATGGFMDTSPVDETGLGPNDRVPGAQPYKASSPSGYDPMNNQNGMAEGGPLEGDGDGMSDSIPANIDGKRPAKVATGEFVVPVGQAERYGDKLQKMMKAVRSAAHPKKGEQIKQDAAKREFIRQMSRVKA